MRTGRGLLLLVLTSSSVLAQPAPQQPPPNAVPGTAPVAPEVPSGSEAAPSLPPTPSTEEQLQALREELARQSAQIAAQQAELQRLAEVESAKAAEASLQAMTNLEADAEEYQEKLAFYGFMDMGLQKMWLGSRSVANPVIESAATTFVLGKVNLYIDARPAEQWRALAEVRFTTYPHGQFTLGGLGQGFQRTSTTIQDTNSSSGGWAIANWGAIIMERAQIEWSGAEWFNVKAGYWLTPYGIWNVDHGSPTLIALNEPQFVVFEGFPARQLGVDVNGVFHATAWDFEYHAYVSNGRTPGQQALSEGKMFGGRLVARTSSPVQLALGASGFYGRISDKQVNVTSVTPFAVSRDEVVAASEMGLGADISLDAGPLRFRSEFVLNERRYDTGKRPSTVFGTPADNRTWSAYGLLAYQLPWAGLEPYAYFEYNRNLLPSVAQVATMSSVGLNIHFTPATQLKLQYSHDEFWDVDDLGRDFSGTDQDFLASRLVVSF
jgi:hypothetical protein